LLVAEKHSQAKIVDTAIVRYNGKILSAVLSYSSDQVLWDTAQTEAASADSCTILDVLGRLGG